MPLSWGLPGLLGWLQAEPGKAEICAGTSKMADQGEVLIITSALTIAEVLWMRGAPMIPQDKVGLVRRFFRRSYLRVRNVTRVVSESAQDLVWSQGVRPKDAIHLATALSAGVVALETFDDQLGADEEKSGANPLKERLAKSPPEPRNKQSTTRKYGE